MSRLDINDPHLNDGTTKAVKSGYKPVRDKHQHSFTIAVEWKYTHSDPRNYEKIVAKGIVLPLDLKKAIKLRCPCGEEVDR